MRDWGLLLPFDTDDPEFVRGFEAGRLFERVRNDHSDWSQLIHATNAEMVMRMCATEDRSFQATEVDDTWMEVHIS